MNNAALIMGEQVSVDLFFAVSGKLTFAEWEEVAERLTAASVIPDVFDGGSRLPMTREWLRPGDQQGGIQ